jgi:hypothetical protein
MVSVRRQDQENARPGGAASLQGILNTCHAFDEKSPVVAALRERLGIP